jgi:MarR family transcriptional regulator for hemolysin
MSTDEKAMEFAGDLSLQLMMTYRSLHQLFNKFLDNAELAQHYHLLFMLTRMGGIATQTDLVRYLKVGESTTRASINVLEEKGYVTRERHNKHNRTHIIRITEKAKIVMSNLRDAMKNVELVAFRNLNEDRLFHLWTTLIKINGNIDSVS